MRRIRISNYVVVKGDKMDKSVTNRAGVSLEFQVLVFHVTSAEAAVVERALRRFGGPRRRRGAALARAVRVAGRRVHVGGETAKS